MKKEVGPLYQKLKDYIIKHIDNGDWLPSQRVLSEYELVDKFNVSRMTANRALRELTSEGYIQRIPGVGSFVAEPEAESHLLEIHNIADEIESRGHTHSLKIISNKKVKAKAELANQMQIKPGSSIFHSVIIHMENHIPIQHEDRYVNPQIAPEYGKVDFNNQTPGEYLLAIAPLQQVEHTVHARQPDLQLAKRLHMADNEACLIVNRRTWSNGNIATVVTLSHPGSRYHLSGMI
jgi:GntR family histidine utilization transcriptional repressor